MGEKTQILMHFFQDLSSLHFLIFAIHIYLQIGIIMMKC
jgi:hypothetical protein